ncbi:acyltransferase family protein [Plantactinospora endophytica]|uniref:Integral membrane transferase n=1 Tax=Plantactinospora endophytica TaxID=673535 RepID=A0ABQ4DSM4_9ACTN|nr:acyltransferase [Plantactinospora endophytica]GIG85448.1 integral membrane transferase [Plantactinospora endophytica]
MISGATGAAETVVPNAPAGTPTPAPPTGRAEDPAPDRDRYLDLLRAGALVRVLVYHVSGWLWLSLLLPAMGLMFGIGGSLMVASLDRSGNRAIGRRLRRLLLPYWAYGAAALLLVTAAGWRTAPAGPLGWGELLWWLVPLRVPPAGDQPWSWALHLGLWYVVTYLWLVLLSPALLGAFRRWPWPTLALGTALPVGLHLAGVGVGYFVASYLACWLLGFAHHDGLLHRIPARWYGCLVAGLAVTGGSWLAVAVATNGDLDLNHIPGGSTLWSMAWVAALLRLRPELHRFAGPRPLGRALRLVNARAVTIYLWHIPAGLAVTMLLDPLLPFDSAAHLGLRLAGVCLLTAVAVLLLGWIEDIAARRRPALLPPATGSADTGPGRYDGAETRHPEGQVAGGGAERHEERQQQQGQ